MGWLRRGVISTCSTHSPRSERDIKTLLRIRTELGSRQPRSRSPLPSAPQLASSPTCLHTMMRKPQCQRHLLTTHITAKLAK